MNRKHTLLCETAQDITLVAWPILYGSDNPYDFDSRMLLDHFREWAEEFERTWDKGDDYLLAVEEFAEAKALAFLQRSGRKEKADETFVRHTLDNLLLGIVEDVPDRQSLVGSIAPEVLADCYETADGDFTSEDVRIALARLICNNLCKD